MLLTIHNLPSHMRYADIKSLITSKCGIKEVILDNLVYEGRNKKVTVGLAEDEDAAMLVRQINGLFVEGNQLYVMNVGQKKSSDQPYHQSYNNYNPSQDNLANLSQDGRQADYPTSQALSNYQQMNYPQPAPFPNQAGGYQTGQSGYQTMGQGYQKDGNQQVSDASQAQQAAMNPMLMQYMAAMNMGGMYYLPQGQNPYMEFPGQSQQLPSSASQFPQIAQQVQVDLGQDANMEDKWSRERRAQRENDGQDSSHRPDQQSGWRGNDRRSSPRRGRSRSPRSRDNRDRSRRDSRHSPKSSTNEDRSRTSPRKRSTNRDSQRYPERDHSKNNGNNHFNTFFNKPITATSSNAQSQANQNPWSSKTNCSSSYQQQASDRFSNSGSNGANKDTTSTDDSQSNYRKHMEMLRVQLKNNSANPDKNSGNSQQPSDDRSPYKWKNPNLTNPRYPSISDNQQSMTFQSPPQKKWEPPVSKPFKRVRTRNRKGVIPTIRMDTATRFNAAGRLTNEISKAHPDIIKQEHLKHLRTSVRSRLEVLLSERLGVSEDDMVETYRQKFPATKDREFCQLIVSQVTEEDKDVDLTDNVRPEGSSQDKPPMQASKSQPNRSRQNNQNQGTNQPREGMNQPIQNTNQPKQGINEPNQGSNQRKRTRTRTRNKNKQQPPVSILQAPDPTKKLPKYPNADKQVYKEQKKLKKQEFQNEDMYELPPQLKQALNAEMEAIVDIYKSVASSADSEKEKDLCDRFLSVGLEKVRTAIKVNITKRILNLTTNLNVRVTVHGRPPNKQDLELYLRRHNVISLKKSSKKVILYVATCRDWQTYDKLLEMKTVQFTEDTTLVFRPFQLAGPKLSYRERQLLRSQGHQGIPTKNTSSDPEGDDESLAEDQSLGEAQTDLQDVEQEDYEIAENEGDFDDMELNEDDLVDY